MSDHRPTAVPPDAPENAGYEKRDVKARGIVIGLVAGVLIVSAAIIGLTQLYIMTREEIVQENVLSKPDPRLRELNAEETRILNSYAIVDSAKGVVRIPIERAMEVMVEEAHRERSGK